MRTVIGGLFSLAFLALIVLAAKATGWSPLDLIFGQQYRAQHPPKSDSRAAFLRENVPELYPRLLKSLETGGREIVRWQAQSGEQQEQVLSLDAQRLLIETSILTGTSPSAAASSTDKTFVQMADMDLDGSMDRITYIEPSGRRHTFERPFDETSLYLWDTSLAITFRFGTCCE